MHLFVYGTLKPNERNYSAIEHLVVAHQSATVRGILRDLGGFPAMIEGEGIVRGVLLELDSRAIAITDRIEGYSPTRDHCLFNRIETTAEVESGAPIKAWTYVFADANSIVDYPLATIGHLNDTPLFAWSSHR